ncbi:hypothetical protein PUNSTDRAFT_37299, partial [Punctularia strigosozonata HHB-11173 SS5]|uniref:uncharacterized protein n=1 Tax=Punctularia strigosozonata (strain HHB-11173) TaxID=741275 RepID=UPI00044183AC
FPYMCIRAFQFVATRMARHPVYPQVLREGRTGNTILLDIGCMMGTDARKAVYDGYPAEKVLACDLRLDFIEIGYGLFEDKDKCRIHFFQSDVFEIPLDVSSHDAPVPLKEVSRLEHLQGRVDHIYTGAVFHLFDESTQVAMALRLATLVPKDRPAIIFGRHRGQFTAGLTPGMSRSGPRYIHSPESWKALWE